MTTDPGTRPTLPDLDVSVPPAGFETVADSAAAPAAPPTSDATMSIGDPSISRMSDTPGSAAATSSGNPPAAPLPAPPASGTEAWIGDPVAAVPAPAPTERPDPADSTTGQLLRTLTDNIRDLVQGEVASARQEMTDKALAARPAAAMLGGAAVLGALATGTSAVVLVRFLDRFLPPTTSAAVATALLGGGGAVLARAGVEELRRLGPPVPERTLESVKADVSAVTDAASA